MNNNSFIHPDARIGKNVEIGPFCYISGEVEIGDNCKIGPNVTIFDYVKIGGGCNIFPGAVIGGIPQDLKYEGEVTRVEIGENTTIRECATVNRGTAASGKYLTKVGSNCLLMSYVHVAHDCVVGDNCILAGYTGLAGEVVIDDFATLGGGVLVHQFCHIGSYTMLGGGNTVIKDVPPFVLASRNPVVFEGLNIVGLRRKGFSNETIGEIKEIYRMIYQGGMTVSDACIAIKGAFPRSTHRDMILSFVENSGRGIIKCPVK
ncbi:MAG: acyl-ACP--UDP-N-acetylglucosamine O-acyltransferase [Bacteroidales bacterium]|nr:acyl-ACP--UDP-N-acetylglucosamine O-acyltransferase [Bacteroidales bacterium]